jgi:hypothetical protein
MSFSSSQNYFEKLLAILRVRPVVAGLEVSDEVIRLAYFDGKLWQMHAIRLLPGVVENGQVKDRNAFVASLGELKVKSGITGHDRKKKANVVVTLGSANPYSKVFTLPIIEGESLENAIVLNLEMVSPDDREKTYGSWQIVSRDTSAGTVEVLASFIERGLVDGIVDALLAAGFTSVAVESKALALTRVLREKGTAIDAKKPYIFIAVDSTGVDFLIVKNGVPYFEYDRRWMDIGDAKGEIPMDVFKSDLATGLRQVLNFYAQRWSDPLGGVVLSTVAFHDEIENTIAANAGLPAVRLTLEMGQPISSEWLAVLGSCLRGSKVKLGERQEITFLGEELQDRFHEEQAIRFLAFWQVILPVSLAILVVVVIGANVFLGGLRNSIESESGFSLLPSQNMAIAQFEASSTDFNNEVAMISGVEANQDPSYGIMDDISTISAANGVTISRLSFSSLQTPLTLSGLASSEAQVLAFKAALEADSHISQVTLPLSAIQPAGTNYSFSLTFFYKE